MTGAFSGSAGTGHVANLGSLPADDYTYYVRCKDEEGNTSTSGTKVTFTVSEAEVTDTTAPIITNNTSGTYPSGDDVLLSISTNEWAECRYDSVEDKNYDSMKEDFALTRGTKHTKLLLSSDLSEGSYTYYIRCQDLSENVGAAQISFVVTVYSAPGSAEKLYAAGNNFLQTGLSSVGSLFVSTAIAQEDDGSTDDGTTTTTDTAGTDTEDDFLEQGSTKNGLGRGTFTGRLENLKPGTFFYVRAYAIVDGTAYYGNQLTLQTADSCFVATAAFGSLFHPSVKILRDFRDRFMLHNSAGHALVRLYYHYSPPIADVISSNSTLRSVTRILLLPITGAAWLTMHFGWLWLLVPAAVLMLLTWFSIMPIRYRYAQQKKTV
jgi:hypothetical protein